MVASPQSFKAALVQMRSGRDVDENLETAVTLIRDAAGGGAHYVQTPENTLLMEADTGRVLDIIRPEAETAAIPVFAALAAELRIWLHIGSIAVKASARRARNRGFLFSPEGAIFARYDKIHMFDVNLPSGEVYRESATYDAGDEAVLVRLPWGGLGLGTCYDLRFPEHFKALAKAGASFFTVPSAFTKVTGEAHWHTLLRARAIENGCFVFAAAQGGRHANGRSTFGHSLIVSPWGEIRAEAGTEPGIVVAEIDVSEVGKARERIPTLDHTREFKVVTVE